MRYEQTYGPGPNWYRFGEQIIDVSLVMNVLIATTKDEDDDEFEVCYVLRGDHINNTEHSIFGEEAQAFWKFMCESAISVLPAVIPEPDDMPF